MNVYHDQAINVILRLSTFEDRRRKRWLSETPISEADIDSDQPRCRIVFILDDAKQVQVGAFQVTKGGDAYLCGRNFGSDGYSIISSGNFMYR